MRYTSADLLAPLRPCSHQYGMSMVLLAATTGAGLLVVPGRRPDLVLSAVVAHRASVVDAGSCGAQVHVAAVPDVDRGCRLVLFVEDDSGAAPQDWWPRLRGVLGEHELPNRVIIIDRLPLTGNGKIDSRRLQHLASAAVGGRPRPAGLSLVVVHSRQEASHGG